MSALSFRSERRAELLVVVRSAPNTQQRASTSLRTNGWWGLLLLGLAACTAQPQQPSFPKAHRDVSAIVGDSFSTEDARDRLGEAEEVMRLADITPGMWVADVGAGEGYYAIRLAPAVGRKGRVLAEDIRPEVRTRLLERVQREELDNVAVRLGTPENPMLPPHSFDRIFLVHMYHEVEEPYEFLWHLREGLKPDGQVVVVDADRPTKRHGIPPPLLQCEFAAVGLQLVSRKILTGGDSYFAAFRIATARPQPKEIKGCKAYGASEHSHMQNDRAFVAFENHMTQNREV